VCRGGHQSKSIKNAPEKEKPHERTGGFSSLEKPKKVPKNERQKAIISFAGQVFLINRTESLKVLAEIFNPLKSGSKFIKNRG
jgi:hypothetical protein